MLWDGVGLSEDVWLCEGVTLGDWEGVALGDGEMVSLCEADALSVGLSARAPDVKSAAQSAARSRSGRISAGNIRGYGDAATSEVAAPASDAFPGFPAARPRKAFG